MTDFLAFAVWLARQAWRVQPPNPEPTKGGPTMSRMLRLTRVDEMLRSPRGSEPSTPCVDHWWYYVRPNVLKCKRCGALKCAPAR
jgi:hypothetical protein